MIRYDGWTSLSGGVNSGVAPTEVSPNEGYRAYNATHRGGFPEQRPGFVRQRLNVVNITPADFTDGIFQCAGTYRSDDGSTYLMAMVGGKVFELDVDHMLQGVNGPEIPVEEITWGNPNPTNSYTGWMYQAENLLVIQDGQSLPVLWNGASARNTGFDEIKPGTCGAYIQGRLWYALPDGKSFRATDLVYSDGTREAVVKETENTYLNEGGDFVVPSDAGDIRAIVAPGMLDTSLGQGPVHVLCENKVVTVNAPVDRTIWKELNFPIATQGQVTNGALSARSTVIVNGDIFYRAKDGIRSYRIARNDFNGWPNSPISGEVDYWLDGDTQHLLRFGSGVVFQNRVLMTATPRMTDYGVTHNSLVVMDFAPVSVLRRKDPPSWDGIWTGLRVHQIVAGDFATGQRCFMFCRNGDDELELWEIDPTSQFDSGDSNIRVEWGFESRGMVFGNQNNRKYLNGGKVYVEALSGTVDFTVQWRPDAYPGWYTWYGWQECATTQQCFAAGECSIKNLKPQYRSPVTLPQPPETCNVTNATPAREFFYAQMRFGVVGPARVAMAVFSAEELLPKAFECPGSTCSEADVCESDPLEYSSET